MSLTIPVDCGSRRARAAVKKIGKYLAAAGYGLFSKAGSKSRYLKVKDLECPSIAIY
jgi:hypothetical protein